MAVPANVFPAPPVGNPPIRTDRRCGILPTPPPDPARRFRKRGKDASIHSYPQPPSDPFHSRIPPAPIGIAWDITVAFAWASLAWAVQQVLPANIRMLIAQLLLRPFLAFGFFQLLPVGSLRIPVELLPDCFDTLCPLRTATVALWLIGTLVTRIRIIRHPAPPDSASAGWLPSRLLQAVRKRPSELSPPQ